MVHYLLYGGPRQTLISIQKHRYLWDQPWGTVCSMGLWVYKEGTGCSLWPVTNKFMEHFNYSSHLKRWLSFARNMNITCINSWYISEQRFHHMSRRWELTFSLSIQSRSSWPGDPRMPKMWFSWSRSIRVKVNHKGKHKVNHKNKQD